MMLRPFWVGKSGRSRNCHYRRSKHLRKRLNRKRNRAMPFFNVMNLTRLSCTMAKQSSMILPWLCIISTEPWPISS
ncbi:hypothetical protein BCR43DRAFT_482041 [Syncephalastrum racemosum]|uniref:Uncharacterized protein n=1 Tax=Syncephalastrum racemosum TaxID=13706 RepID=A0A1X2HT09_SYNRA|nr:hypothetical protein BCR43DRAFT_482041 [Syncephalastrum racemosum]